MSFLKGSIITGVIAGLIGGGILVFFWEKWLRSKSYGYALLNIFWSYTLVFLVVATISGLFFHGSQLNAPFFSQDVWQV